jgi:hypothetical protein
MFGNFRSPSGVCQEKLSEKSRDFSLNQKTLSRSLNKPGHSVLKSKSCAKGSGVGILQEEPGREGMPAQKFDSHSHNGTSFEIAILRPSAQD